MCRDKEAIHKNFDMKISTLLGHIFGGMITEGQVGGGIVKTHT